MNPQEILLNKLRNLIPKNISLNEEIAKVLDISYDAAHRRISLKSKFSIDETVKLCQHYAISLDRLFGNKENLIIEKTKKIETLKDFKSYFETTKGLLSELKPEETTVYYAAKDIPMNYAAAGSLYSKFKFYVWYNLLTKQQTINFESFIFEESVFIDHTDLKHFFNSTKRIEIWNDTTINSSLQQLFYFFESGLLHYKNALHILEDLNLIIENMEQKCEIDSPEFQMYYNELLILNNSVLFTSKPKSIFFLPYDALGYYATRDIKACEEQREYIENQLLNSKSLNKSGKKDRKIFFNRIYQKIEFYRNKIENYVIE
ncbi:hypothetical protein ACFSX9_14755 [Flavobacterium ardleyense]|uniref:Transcription regulator BetR N-terminal domain-containing protein n=1 Tax=Flavobacterium ardleyense TaxID=2038737 RepID=A0ABW5ZEV4_9FLAO